MKIYLVFAVCYLGGLYMAYLFVTSGYLWFAAFTLVGTLCLKFTTEAGKK